MKPSLLDSPSRPSLGLLGLEPLRAAMELASLGLGGTDPAPSGDGHPVIIFPGLASDGVALGPLRKHCKALGYAAYDWGRGFNTGPRGDVDLWLLDLAKDVLALLDGHPKTATLIGWSLGGLYAREVAKLIAPKVRQVITIGTPFNVTGDHTNVGWLFRMLSGKQAHTDEAMSRRLRTPPQLPTTSIFSRTDGIVAWQACCHPDADDAERVEDIEISGSHLGMGWNPAVLQIVGDRLAQPVGRWRPYHLDAPAGDATRVRLALN